MDQRITSSTAPTKCTSVGKGSFLKHAAKAEAAYRPGKKLIKNGSPFLTLLQEAALSPAGEEERKWEGVRGGKDGGGNEDGGRIESDGCHTTTSTSTTEKVLTPDTPSSSFDELDDDVSDEEGENLEIVIANEERDEDREVGQEMHGSVIPEDSQDPKALLIPGWRSKTKQKIQHGVTWVQENLCYDSNSKSVVSLNDVGKKYTADCHVAGQEPLQLSVMGRLIHQHFPKAGKSRLGPRRCQKTHYTNLRLKVSSPYIQWNSVTTPRTPLFSKIGKAPFEASPPQLHGEAKQPLTFESGRGTEKKQHVVGEIQRALSSPSPDKDTDNAQECPDAAARLKQVIIQVSQHGKMHILLKNFSHSASCGNIPCTSLCLMFRRVRRHVVNARHQCNVKSIYYELLKQHVASCISNDCGLKACPILRAYGQTKRSLDEDQKPAKRPNVKDINSIPCLLPHQPYSPLTPPPSGFDHLKKASDSLVSNSIGA